MIRFAHFYRTNSFSLLFGSPGISNLIPPDYNLKVTFLKSTDWKNRFQVLSWDMGSWKLVGRTAFFFTLLTLWQIFLQQSFLINDTAFIWSSRLRRAFPRKIHLYIHLYIYSLYIYIDMNKDSNYIHDTKKRYYGWIAKMLSDDF